MYGEGNSYTAPFWQYDTRLGRRWNLDPKGNVEYSLYSCFGNNPVFYKDVLGDTLDIGTTYDNGTKSKEDILSLIDSKNQTYVTFTDGRVGLDFGTLNETEIQDILDKDEGLDLVNDLVKSDKKFMYDATDIYLGEDESGTKAAKLVYQDDNQVINASNYGKDSNGGHHHRPKTGYDGMVIIHPDAQFNELDVLGNPISKSRSSIVFHELAENLERTHNNINYNGGFFSSGAHFRAQTREGKWWGKSSKPGVVDGGIVPGSAPTEDRKKEIQNMVNEYMGK